MIFKNFLCQRAIIYPQKSYVFIFLILCFLQSTILFANFPVKSITSFSKSDTIHHQGMGFCGYLSVWKESETVLDPAILLDQSFDKKFQNPCDIIPKNKEIWWGKVKIVNHLSTPELLQNWVLGLGNTSFVDIYFYDNDGQQLDVKQSGDFLPQSKKDFKYGNRLERIPFSWPTKDTLTLLLKYQRINGSGTSFKIILSQDDYIKDPAYLRGQRSEGIFLGFLLSVLILQLLFWIGTREINFFYHFMFILGIVLFLSGEYDIICDAPIFRENPYLGIYFAYISATLMDLGYLQLISNFFSLKEKLPKWYKIVNVLSFARIFVAIIALLIFAVSFNEKLGDQVCITYVVPQYLILLVLMGVLIFKKFEDRYFMVAATILFIFCVFINSVSILSAHGIEKNLTQVGIVTVNIFFILGLSSRMRRNEKQKQEDQKSLEINQFKDQLYANITHEFRTPLSVIKGMSEQLRKPNLLPKDHHKSIDLIQKNSDQLLDMVNQILYLSKLESGKMTIKLQQVDIIAYLRYLTDSIASLAHTKNQHLQFLTELEYLEMDVDLEKIREIIINLLSNAIKFTNNNGEILLKVQLIKRPLPVLNIEVKDTGIGISEKDLPQIFIRFYQTSNAINTTSQGSGLGLAMVQELVKLMKGKITVKSQLDSGTSFLISLPISKTAPKLAIQDWEATQIPVQSTPSFENIEIVGEVMDSTVEKPILLIIEDSLDIVYYLKELLSNEYQISVALNGQLGIEKAFEIVPDIILSDVMMPEKDGLEVCELLKNSPTTSHIPIILLTAKASIQDRVKGLSRGADAYLAKPFNEKELFFHLKNLIDSRKKWQDFLQSPLSQEQLEIENEDLKIEDVFLSKIQEIIHENIDDSDFGIPQLCRKLGTSRTQLHRKITALTNRSTSIFIRSIRLQEAKKLLKNSEMNVSEVAFSIGFKDPNYFTKCFSEEFGMSPSHFKNAG
jgi:signal transduction histidine kinase/DNA-binding response OmpR family regulator